MTIYLTSKPSTLIGHYLREYKRLEVEYYVCSKWEELTEITCLPPKVKEDMELEVRVNLVIPQFDRPGKELNHSPLNETYIVGITPGLWKGIQSKHKYIKNLRLNLKEYDKRFKQLEKLLTPSAFKWFKSQYYNSPIKVEWERRHLEIKVKEVKRKLGLEDLDIIYGTVGKSLEFYSYIHHLGNQVITNRILFQLDNNTLWLGFIGKNTPFIYKPLLEKWPETIGLLDTFRTQFLNGRVELNPGVFILNFLINQVICSVNKGKVDYVVLNQALDLLQSL